MVIDTVGRTYPLSNILRRSGMTNEYKGKENGDKFYHDVICNPVTLTELNGQYEILTKTYGRIYRFLTGKEMEIQALNFPHIDHYEWIFQMEPERKQSEIKRRTELYMHMESNMINKLEEILGALKSSKLEREKKVKILQWAHRFAYCFLANTTSYLFWGERNNLDGKSNIPFVNSLIGMYRIGEESINFHLVRKKTTPERIRDYFKKS